MDPRGNIITELSLDDPTVASPTWQDISAYVKSSSISRGRESELDQIQPGTASFVLRNDDRTFDPSYPLGPYYGYLVPMRRIRQRVTNGGYSVSVDNAIVATDAVTDAIRSAAASGDGRPYEPFDFKGGFETGNETEWTSIQAAEYSIQFQTVTNPSRDGGRAAKFTVRNGDTVAAGERCEVVRTTPRAVDGDEYFYAWSTYFPTDYNSTITGSQFKIFTQWKDSADLGPPLFGFRTVNGTITLSRNTGVSDAGGVGTSVSTDTLLSAFTLGVWHDFIVQIRWRTASTGIVNVWHKEQSDGAYTLVYAGSSIPTLLTTGAGVANSDVYIKEGMYRNIAPDTYTTVLYHDAFRIGRSFYDMVNGEEEPDSSYGIWPGTTNYVLQGNAQTVADWIVNGTGTVTAQTEAFVFSGASSTRALVSTPGAATGEGVRVRRTGLSESGKTYVASIFAQLVPGQISAGMNVFLIVSYSDATSDTGTSAFNDLTNYPKRLYAPAVVSNGAKTVTSVRVCVQTTGTAQARQFYVGGCQIEEGTVATPYVHTAGSAASRTAARAQMPLTAQNLNSTQGWVVIQVRPGFKSTDTPATNPYAWRWRVDDNNEIYLRYDTTNDRWTANRKAAGTGTSANATATPYPERAYQFVIVAWTATAIKISLDGAAFVSAADTNIPAMTGAAFDIGSSIGVANWLYGDVRWMALGTGTLSDADASSLYETWGKYRTDPLPTSVDDSVWPSAATVTLTWSASDTRVMAQDSAYLFTGFVESWGQTWPDRLFQGETSVSATDTFKVLNLAAQPISRPNVEGYEDVVNFAEPSLFYGLGDPAGTKLSAKARRGKLPPGVVLASSYRGVSRNHKRVTRSPLESVSGPSGTYINTPQLGQPGLIAGDLATSVRFRSAQSEYAYAKLDDDTDLISTDMVAIEAWVNPDTVSVGQTYTVASYGLIAGNSAPVVALALNNPATGGAARFDVYAGVGSPFFAVSVPGSIVAGTTYHLVGLWDGTTAYIYINGVVENSMAGTGALQSPDANSKFYIGANPSSGFYFDGRIQYVAVYESLTPARILNHYIAGTRGYNEEPTGTRIQNAIDAIGFTIPTSLDDGERDILPVRQFGQSTLQPIDEAVEVEGGGAMVFCKGDGTVTFFDRNYKTGALHANSVVSVGDADTDDVPMEDVVPFDDESMLYNRIIVEASEGEPQEAEDGDSQAKYFPRTHDLTGVLMVSDDDALEEAEELLATYKEAQQRIRSVVINPRMNDTAAENAIIRELGDHVTVNRRPLAGLAISQDGFIQRITHEIDFENSNWLTTWSVSGTAVPSVTASDFFAVTLAKSRPRRPERVQRAPLSHSFASPVLASHPVRLTRTR